MSVTEEPQAASARWWEQPDVEQLWHGVFKGGGAKGVAYGGALQAVAEHRAGLEPDRIRDAAPEMLKKVRSNRLGMVLAGSTPLYSLAGVTGWLRGLLREQVTHFAGPRADAEHEVTFAELFAATEIELHVVVMDLATGAPIVLSHRTTPSCEVAAAVAASCSIPVGFDSRRLIMRGDGDRLAVHRVVDGGAWANYPQFVFKDASFREYTHLPALPEDAIVVGFVLDRGRHDEALAPWGFRYDLETEELEDSGLFVRSGPARFILTRLDKTWWRLLSLVLWPLLMIAVTGWWLFAERAEWEPIRDRLSGWLPLGWGVLAGTFSISVLILMALAGTAYLFGRELIRVGIGTVIAALGVSTDVPPWLGTAPGDWVVRVPIPPTLSTRSFKMRPADLDQVIANAHTVASGQIGSILAGTPTAIPPQARVAEPPRDIDVRPLTYLLVRRDVLCAWLLWIAFATAVFGDAVLEPALDGTAVSLRSVLTLLAATAIPIYGIVTYARGGQKRRRAAAETARRAAARTAAGLPPAPGDERPTPGGLRRRAGFRALCCVLVVVLTVGTFREELKDFHGETVEATIQGRTDVTSATFIYEALIQEGAFAGRVFTFDAHKEVSVGDHVTLRWVRLPQGLEFASSAPAGLLWIAALGGSIAMMFLLGVIWAMADLRRVRDTESPAAGAAGAAEPAARSG